MKQPYIIDTSIFVSLNRGGYCLEDGNDDFWEYILQLAHENYIKVPETVCEELKKGKDKLAIWVHENKDDLILKTSSLLVGAEYTRVLATYNELAVGGLTENDVERIGTRADAYVIAHAIKENGTVASNEMGHKKATSADHIRIPSVCEKLKVPHTTLPKFIWNIAQKNLIDKFQ